MVRNIDKNISKNLSDKSSQIDHTKQFVTDAFETASKRAIQKLAEATSIWLVTKLLIK